MKTQVQQGDVLQYTNAGSAISSGDAVIIGNCVGVAAVDIATSATGSVAVAGTYTLVKVTGAVIAQGETVTYDISASNVDDNAATAATGDIEHFGVAVTAAGAGVLTVDVRLNPGAGRVKA